MPIEDTLLKLTWTLAAWDDYEYWQGQDRKTLKRINALLRNCLRHPSAFGRAASTTPTGWSTAPTTKPWW